MPSPVANSKKLALVVIEAYSAPAKYSSAKGAASLKDVALAKEGLTIANT